VDEAKLYGAVRPDVRFWTRDGAFVVPTREVFRSFVDEKVEMSKSPGVPWLGLGCKTNLDVLEAHEVLLYDIVMEHFATLEHLKFSDIKSFSALDFLRYNLCDPVKPFIKGEPHTASKLEAERYRIIFGLSLTDMIIDQIIWSALVQHDIDNWKWFETVPGMGLDDEGREVLIERWQQQCDEHNADAPLSTDVSAWDWCIRLWHMMPILVICMLRYRIRSGSTLGKAMLASLVMAFRKTCLLGDGTLVVIRDFRSWCSGKVITAFFNSLARAFWCKLLGGKDPTTMGDDCTEFDTNLARYLSIGLRVEAADLPRCWVEFCSTHFDLDTGEAYLTTVGRTTFKLLNHAPDRGQLAQYEYELRGNPRLPAIVEIVKRLWKF
jgi:hypothetical protein